MGDVRDQIQKEKEGTAKADRHVSYRSLFCFFFVFFQGSPGQPGLSGKDGMKGEKVRKSIVRLEVRRDWGHMFLA